MLVLPVVSGAAVVVLLAACGAGAEAEARRSDPVVPTTDDASLVTVAPPQTTTLDLAALTATPSATIVVGDGLTYAVTGQVCGLAGVRADAYAVRAEGQFCLVQVDVTNTGDAVVRFIPDRALLLDGVDGVAPSERALVLSPLAAMEADVPPSTTLSGSLVYDVPAVEADRELRFDDGPTVRLSAVGSGAGAVTG